MQVDKGHLPISRSGGPPLRLYTSPPQPRAQGGGEKSLLVTTRTVSSAFACACLDLCAACGDLILGTHKDCNLGSKTRTLWENRGISNYCYFLDCLEEEKRERGNEARGKAELSVFLN